MDDFQIGRLSKVSGISKKGDFSDVDPALFGETLAKELNASDVAPALGAAVKSHSAHSIEPKPPISMVKVDFSNSDLHDMFSQVKASFTKAGL